MIDPMACITSRRSAGVAELGVGAGSTGQKIGTATPRRGGMWGPFCPAVTGWAFPFCLVDPAQGWDRALC